MLISSSRTVALAFSGLALLACRRPGSKVESGSQGHACAGTSERTPSREHYPVRLAVVSDDERAAIAERFRTQNPARWDSVAMSPLGFVEQSHAPGAGWRPRGSDAASTAAAFFTRNASFFGVTPAHRGILDACADRSSSNSVVFWQYWGPYRVGELFLSDESTSGHFLGDLGLAPTELDDATLTAPLVGRTGTLTTTRSEHFRPCDPGPGGHGCPRDAPPTPQSSQRPYALRAKDMRVRRGVAAFASPTDPRVGELRIVATIEITLNHSAHQGPGSGWTSTETVTEFAFDRATKTAMRYDAITGEALDDRQAPIYGR